MDQALNVIYEDNHVLAINKEPGVLVQGDETRDPPLVDLAKAYVGKKYSKPGAVFLGVVHRLDRPVSGVVVFARTSKSLERLNTMFRNRETEKTYWAVVSRKPPKISDTLIHWLVKDEKKNKTTAYRELHPEGLKSELSYQLVSAVGSRYLLEVKPVTGRPHQIRVQLAMQGCPIIGDLKYGAESPLEDASIALHARSLRLIHPVRKDELTIQAEPPLNSFWSTISFPRDR